MTWLWLRIESSGKRGIEVGRITTEVTAEATSQSSISEGKRQAAGVEVKGP
jgi:hypothetical protein